MFTHVGVWSTRLFVVLAALGCGGDGEAAVPDARVPDAHVPDAQGCVAQTVVVPAHGICDRPVSTPENTVEYALCVEYTGADVYPYDIEEQCTSQGGKYYPLGRACTSGGSVGRCVKARGQADSETVNYYYPPRWDATTAGTHCSDEDGELEATDDSICAAVCGNGVAETPGEACDDGNLDGGDGCDASCAIE
jgi:cysteine-rich repeat protein